MAGSALTVHTRVVRARRRADSRASTEPHQRAAEPVHETTPYRRDFSPEAEDRTAAHRDSLPYCELAIVAERKASPPESAAAVSLDGTTERDLPPPPEQLAESSDVWTVRHEKAERAETSKVSTLTATCARGESADELAVTSERKRLGRGSGAQAKHDAASAQPKRAITSATVEDKPPRIAGSLSWLGVVVAQPEVGAPLVIGTWLSPEFRVTSPVAKLVEREGGVLVQTATKSRYFVKTAGDTYLVSKAGKVG